MREIILVCIDSTKGGVDAERTAKHLQRFATAPLDIHIIPPCSTSDSLFQRLRRVSSWQNPFSSWLYLQEGFTLSVGWEQAFLRAASAFAKGLMAWVPTDWFQIADSFNGSELREEEIYYLSRYWSHRCAGWTAPIQEISGYCVGFHGTSMGVVGDYLSLELRGFDWLQAVDTFVFPIGGTVPARPWERHRVSSLLSDNVFLLAQERPSQPKPSLGLAMIVKNESARLERTIRSVESLVDKIVIADTGSEDSTPQQAAALGAQVIDIPWTDDFSAARNAVLDVIDTEWVLVLDPDEEIAFSDFSRLREALLQPGVWAYELEARNYYRWNRNFAEWVPNDGKYPESRGFIGWVPSYSVRLFRNDPRIRYTGCIHELLDYQLWQCLLPKDSLDIPVHHYGHVEKSGKEDFDQIWKIRMYLQMAESKARRFLWDQAKALWEVGVLWGQRREPDQAVKCYLESIHYNRLFLYSYFSMLGALMALKEYEAVLVVCRSLAKVVKNPVVVEAAEQAQYNLQKTQGNRRFLEPLLLALKPGPWSVFQTISEQSRLWAEKKCLHRSLGSLMFNRDFVREYYENNYYSFLFSSESLPLL